MILPPPRGRVRRFRRQVDGKLIWGSQFIRGDRKHSFRLDIPCWVIAILRFQPDGYTYHLVQPTYTIAAMMLSLIGDIQRVPDA